MAQTASYELFGQNIRVNAICPGLIQVSSPLSSCHYHSSSKTDMTKGLFELAKMGKKEDKMGGINPMNRQGLAHGQFSCDSFCSELINRGCALCFVLS